MFFYKTHSPIRDIWYSIESISCVHKDGCTQVESIVLIKTVLDPHFEDSILQENIKIKINISFYGWSVLSGEVTDTK